MKIWLSWWIIKCFKQVENLNLNFRHSSLRACGFRYYLFCAFFCVYRYFSNVMALLLLYLLTSGSIVFCGVYFVLFFWVIFFFLFFSSRPLGSFCLIKIYMAQKIIFVFVFANIFIVIYALLHITYIHTNICMYTLCMLVFRFHVFLLNLFLLM